MQVFSYFLCFYSVHTFLNTFYVYFSRSSRLFFNRSITTGIFPNEWKCAKVVPNIHKQGKRNCVDNYRPIWIVPVVAKVFERIIYDQLQLYLSENKLLTNCQSGFRGLHSTVTALLEAMPLMKGPTTLTMEMLMLLCSLTSRKLLIL